MMKKLWAIMAIVGLTGGALVGCGDDGDPTPPVDGGMTDTGTPVATLPVAVLAAGGAPDWTCVGEGTAPTAGDPVAFTSTFTGPLSPMVPAGTVVELFPGNAPLATCAAPDCIPATVADNGFSATLPANAWFAIRIPGTSATFPTIGYFRPAPAAAGGMTRETVIGNQVVDIIPGIFSRERLPGTAVISGAAYDCQNRPVRNIEARVYVDGTRVQQGPTATDPFYGYLNGVASTNTPYTGGADAQYAIANIPPGLTRIELWATPADGEDPVRVACEEVTSTADTVLVLSPPPERSDYAAGSGCL